MKVVMTPFPTSYILKKINNTQIKRVRVCETHFQDFGVNLGKAFQDPVSPGGTKKCIPVKFVSQG